MASPRFERVMVKSDRLVVAGGYLDLQINGGWGCDFSRDPASIWTVGERLVQHGVTAFLPTLISGGFDRLDEALDTLMAGPPAGWSGAIPIGFHLEGPWLNPLRRGAHGAADLRPPVVPDRIRREEGVVLVTMAPEIDGGLRAILELRNRGVIVSAGHSAASYEEAVAGFETGVTMGTHIFNAMSGVHHREPGLAAALLTDASAAIGIIVDGEHVAPSVVRLSWQAAGDRLILVSDAVSKLGITEDPVARTADGTLAGATVGIDQGVRNFVAFTDCDLPEAVQAASSRPRTLLGLTPSSDSWTEVDRDGFVTRTVVDGVVLFESSN